MKTPSGFFDDFTTLTYLVLENQISTLTTAVPITFVRWKRRNFKLLAESLDDSSFTRGGRIKYGRDEKVVFVVVSEVDVSVDSEPKSRTRGGRFEVVGRGLGGAWRWIDATLHSWVAALGEVLTTSKHIQSTLLESHIVSE